MLTVKEIDETEDFVAKPINCEDNLKVVAIALHVEEDITSEQKENQTQRKHYYDKFQSNWKNDVIVEEEENEKQVNEDGNSIEAQNPDIVFNSKVTEKPVPQFIELGYKHYKFHVTPTHLQKLNPEEKKKQSKRDASTVVYICHTADHPGKFDPKKAKALGLKPGPIYTQLTKGECVVTEDGRKIKPEDCISAPQPGTIFIVVDCPTTKHMEKLVKQPVFSQYFENGKYYSQVVFILHIAPNEILQEKEYSQWMKQFSPTVQVRNNKLFQEF